MEEIEIQKTSLKISIKVVLSPCVFRVPMTSTFRSVMLAPDFVEHF